MGVACQRGKIVGILGVAFIETVEIHASRTAAAIRMLNTCILQKLFNLQHPVTNANVGLDVLGVRILFDFLTEGCHVYS